MQLAIDFAPFQEMMSALIGGKFDFGVAITERSHANLMHRRVGMLEFALAVPRDMPCPSPDGLLADLHGEQMIT